MQNGCSGEKGCGGKASVPSYLAGKPGEMMGYGNQHKVGNDGASLMDGYKIDSLGIEKMLKGDSGGKYDPVVAGDLMKPTEKPVYDSNYGSNSGDSGMPEIFRYKVNQTTDVERALINLIN